MASKLVGMIAQLDVALAALKQEIREYDEHGHSLNLTRAMQHVQELRNKAIALESMIETYSTFK